MATTNASALAAALRFTVQKQVLQNLRANLVFADPKYSESGRFDSGSDMLTFVGVPDIAADTTVLTEGANPTAKALSITTVTVATAQQGALVAISDLAKVKSPIEIAQIGSERLARQAQETLDTIARDTIALSGTPFFGSVDHTTRVSLDNTDVMTVGGIGGLRNLNVKMKKLKIPPMSDGYYLLLIHPNVEYDIRNDSSTGSWVDVNKYTDPTPLFKGEIGRLSGFRVATVVNAPTVASSVTVYLSFALGGVKPWGAGELQSLQTYHVAPGGDHSDPLAQLEYLGWKCNWGVAALSTSYYVRVESYATALT